MSWRREVVATPEGLAEELAALERPERAAEAAQFDAVVDVVAGLAAVVSKREPMLVTFGGHTDPNGEGFDARNVTVTMSRIEPEDAKRRLEEARAAREAAEAAEQAAREKAEEAKAAEERAAEEAGEAADAASA